MQALILAGGEGTRLRPLTQTKPKPVMPLVNRPFLHYMLTWLSAHGVDRVLISSGFLAAQVEAVLGDRVGSVELGYLEEPRPLGTAGAIKFAASELDERFLVLNGDVLTGIDLDALVRFHSSNDAEATVALTPVEDPTNYGLVRTDETGAIREFVEKPSADQVDTNLINAGAYVLERGVLDLIEPDREVSIEREIFPLMVDQGLYAKADSSYWIDIGTPERYLQATADILAGAFPLLKSEQVDSSAELSDGVYLDSASSVGQGSKVARDTRITGSAIHERCQVGERCTIELSIVASEVLVGDDVTLERGCVVGEGASIAAGNVIAAGSLVGPGEQVSEATVTGGRLG